jgi:tetratricopeptide (TPR) repeat protein
VAYAGSGLLNDNTLLYKVEQEMRDAAQDDPNLARAHAGFAAIYMMQGHKEQVRAEVDQALKVHPEDEDALHMLMLYHLYSGEYAAAEMVGQQVLKRIPLFFPNRMMLGEMLRQQGDLAGAIQEQERILDQDPQNLYALGYMARAYMDAGDLVRARQTLGRGHPGDRQSYRTRRSWAMLLALEHRPMEALKEMDGEVLKWQELVAYETSEMSAFYAVLGDGPKALDWLDRAVQKGDERAEWFRRDPLLAGIRDHPRFQAIMESIVYRRQQRKPL